MRREWLL